MTEYIFDVPDSNQPIAGESALYYPDERDEPMAVGEEIVRCRDCKMFDEHYLKCIRPVLYFDDDHKPHWTNETTFTAVTDATPDGFCAWPKRKEVDA